MSLPNILVTDMNIWIDLEKGNILDSIFHLPYQLLISDFLIAEMKDPSWEGLMRLGLQTHPLNSESILELEHLRSSHRQLSISDLAAFLLAKELEARLVTGDRRLNALAQSQGVEVHGVLWLLDEMVMHNVLKPSYAATALQRMRSNNARLPSVECLDRLTRWSD